MIKYNTNGIGHLVVKKNDKVVFIGEHEWGTLFVSCVGFGLVEYNVPKNMLNELKKITSLKIVENEKKRCLDIIENEGSL